MLPRKKHSSKTNKAAFASQNLVRGSTNRETPPGLSIVPNMRFRNAFLALLATQRFPSLLPLGLRWPGPRWGPTLIISVGLVSQSIDISINAEVTRSR